MVFTTWFREISYCRSVSASRLMRRIGTCGRVSVAAHGIRPGYLGIGVAKFPRRRRFGCDRGGLRGSICWVLLFWGRVCVSTTIIPEAQEHFPPPSTRPDTHLFGGSGLRSAGLWCRTTGMVQHGPCGSLAPRTAMMTRRSGSCETGSGRTATGTARTQTSSTPCRPANASPSSPTSTRRTGPDCPLMDGGTTSPGW